MFDDGKCISKTKTKRELTLTNNWVPSVLVFMVDVDVVVLASVLIIVVVTVEVPSVLVVVVTSAIGVVTVVLPSVLVFVVDVNVKRRQGIQSILVNFDSLLQLSIKKV